MPPLRWSLLAILILLVSAAVAVPAQRTPAATSLTAARVETDFLPSKHGLAFRNPARDPSSPLIEQVTTEQCGGMVYTALDCYLAGTAPSVTSARSLSVQLKSVESIVSNGSRFMLWSAWPDHASSPLEGGVVDLTRSEEIPRLRQALEDGPVPLGLVRARSVRQVGLNHQVVAYRMTVADGLVRIWIYDPTQPQADDVVLVTNLCDDTGVISERAGEWEVARWRGLFVERYTTTLVSR